MDDRMAEARGHKARRELELTDAALTGLRQAALEEIVTSPPEHLAKRERLIVCAQVIDALRAALHASIDDGEVASYRVRLAEQNLLRP